MYVFAKPIILAIVLGFLLVIAHPEASGRRDVAPQTGTDAFRAAARGDLEPLRKTAWGDPNLQGVYTNEDEPPEI